MAVKKTKATTKKKTTEVAPKKGQIRLAAEKEKAAATRRGEPWVGVLNTEFDPENPSSGYFELDWNPGFVAKLLRAGFNGKNEEDIVNQWFEALCKNAQDGCRLRCLRVRRWHCRRRIYRAQRSDCLSFSDAR